MGNLNAAIYARVSTDEQHSDKQVIVCEEYCKRNNIEVFKVYQEIISGATTSRPVFNELLKDMREGKFSVIIVTKLDRLGRSLQHLLSLFDEFQKKGINFIAITQNIDTTTSTGKLQLHLLGAFAEFERNIISERTKEGLKRRKEGKRGKDKKPRKRNYFKKPQEFY